MVSEICIRDSFKEEKAHVLSMGVLIILLLMRANVMIYVLIMVIVVMIMKNCVLVRIQEVALVVVM